jgi:long-chain acyl-CoA synthetase
MAAGYFRTGDAGIFDRDGQLKIIDRAKDVGRMTGGALFAPNYIENKLKFFPHIKEAVAFGNGQAHVCAFINIDLGSVGNWAERRGLAYSGYTDLASKPEVYALMRECIEQVNRELAAKVTWRRRRYGVPGAPQGARSRRRRAHAHAQGAQGIHRREVSRAVDALYEGRAVQHIETLVKFEDGRTGMVAADLRIEDAKTLPATLAKAA